jgi:hypothetical protein
MVYKTRDLIIPFIIFLIALVITFILLRKLGKPFWITDRKISDPFILSIVVSIIILGITLHLSGQMENILNEIQSTTKETYYEVKKLSGEIRFGKETSPPIKIKTTKVPITPDGTITLWLTLNRPKGVYQKGYIFDIADSYVKNRMSLYVDENGFLTWRIIDNNFVIHSLRYDITQFLDGKMFYVALTWSKNGELKMYINADLVSQVKLDRLDLNITSTEMYWGSDIDGNYAINLN